MEGAVKKALPAVRPVYQRILSLFPQQYFRFCFAYGSGALDQGGVKAATKPMLDMVFVVDDPEGFHGQNILLNPSHYSGLRLLGHRVVGLVQRWPAALYYNTLIPLKEEKVVLKYGVIGTGDLVNDLLDWHHLYIAGRLHKPVKLVLPPSGPDILPALQMNLTSALHAAFLILPQYFTERHLYRTIANISYRGDFRMVVGEDKHKVRNIVDVQVHRFRRLYRPLFKNLEDYIEIPEDDSVDQTCMQDTSPHTRMYHLYQLPKAVQAALVTKWHALARRRKQDAEEVFRSIAYYPDTGELVASTLEDIVFKSSSSQSLKGLLSAGLLRSLRYSAAKLNKMMLSRQST